MLKLIDGSIAAPRAPPRPLVLPVPRTTDSLTVDWTAPDNPGRPAIDGYDVRYSNDGGETWTDGPQGEAAGPVTLTGLDRGRFFGVHRGPGPGRQCQR